MINYKCDVKKVTFIKKGDQYERIFGKNITAKRNNDRE